MEFGWQVSSTVASWLTEAVKVARTRKQQRFAHVVANAGVIVVGLRAIDREIRRLFSPLIYFDVSLWSAERRQIGQKTFSR